MKVSKKMSEEIILNRRQLTKNITMISLSIVFLMVYIVITKLN